MYGKDRIAIVNLDKREVVYLTSPAKLLTSTNHLTPDKRGQYHDTFTIKSGDSVKGHQTWLGYLALIGPRNEMADLLNVTGADSEVRNSTKFGSWYGDRIITYSINGNSYSTNGTNPFKRATNDFITISEEANMMGATLLKHFQILG